MAVMRVRVDEGRRRRGEILRPDLQVFGLDAQGAPPQKLRPFRGEIADGRQSGRRLLVTQVWLRKAGPCFHRRDRLRGTTVDFALAFSSRAQVAGISGRKVVAKGTHAPLAMERRAAYLFLRVGNSGVSGGKWYWGALLTAAPGSGRQKLHLRHPLVVDSVQLQLEGVDRGKRSRGVLVHWARRPTIPDDEVYCLSFWGLLDLIRQLLHEHPLPSIREGRGRNLIVGRDEVVCDRDP
jgi:hypothetical protein